MGIFYDEMSNSRLSRHATWVLVYFTTNASSQNRLLKIHPSLRTRITVSKNKLTVSLFYELLTVRLEIRANLVSLIKLFRGKLVSRENRLKRIITLCERLVP